MFSFLLANMIQLLKYAKSFPLSLAWFGNGKVCLFSIILGLHGLCVVLVQLLWKKDAAAKGTSHHRSSPSVLQVCIHQTFKCLWAIFFLLFLDFHPNKVELATIPIFFLSSINWENKYCPSQPLLTSLCVVKCAAFYKTMYVYRLPKKNARPHGFKAWYLF